MSEKTPFAFVANIQEILQILPDNGQIKLADERILPVSDIA